MSVRKVCLSKSMVTTNHVTFFNGLVSLQQEVQFRLSSAEVETLTWFLEASKADDSIRHTYTDERFTLEYDPSVDEFHQFSIARPVIFRRMSMEASTAWKLLDALSGKTEQQRSSE